MDRHHSALDKLRQMIDDGAAVGDDGRLPPERVLADALGVGRRSLRRALDVLEGEGKISRRQGRGTFLNGGALPESMLSGQVLDRTNPIEVMEVRLALEPMIARLAALRASRADIERLAELAERSRTAKTAEDYEQADAAFHRGLAETARNSLFLAVYDVLNVLRHDAAWRQFGENGRCFKRQAVYAGLHKEIVAAISARDGQRAQDAMFNHLNDVQTNFLQQSFPAANEG